MQIPASSTINAIPTATESSTSTIAVPLDTFTPFPNLPLELRRQIWGHAVHEAEARIVEVIIQSNTGTPISHTSSPAILSTNRESREAGLKVLNPLCHGGTFTGAMINWERDTLLFNTSFERGKRLLSGSKNSDLLRKCRRLALSRGVFYGAAHADPETSWCKKLSNLEELAVVVELTNAGVGAYTGRRTSVLFAKADSGCDKYERTGNHLAYAMFLHPNILHGVLVKAVRGMPKKNEPELKGQENPQNTFRHPPTTPLGLISPGSWAESSVRLTINSELLVFEIAKVDSQLAEYARSGWLVENGLVALERRFRALGAQLDPAYTDEAA